LPSTTSEPIWKTSPAARSTPGTRAARRTIRSSIVWVDTKVLVNSVRGAMFASTPAFAVCRMSLNAARI